MKFLSCILFIVLFSACNSSIKNEPPHDQLMGYWRLKVDCYVAKFNDSRELFLVPIAEGYAGFDVLCKIDSGTVFEVVDVRRKWNPEIGNTCYPLFKFLDPRNVDKSMVVDGFLFYRRPYCGSLDVNWVDACDTMDTLGSSTPNTEHKTNTP